MTFPEARPTRSTLTRIAFTALAVALFVGAARLLSKEFAGHSVGEVVDAVLALSAWRVWAALALTVVSYFLLTGYDVLALRHLGLALPYRHTALVSFVSYVGSHNIGLGGLGGAALRWRLYGGFGLTLAETTQISLFAGLSFWLGWAALGAFVFPFFRGELAEAWGLVPWAFVLLVVAQTVFVVGYLVWCRGGDRSWTIAKHRVPHPTQHTARAQLALSAVDWVLVATTAFVLLPADTHLGWWHWLAIFLGAQMIGWLSHVPAGLGVVEVAVINATKGDVSLTQITAALLVYRIVYQLLPLVVGAILLSHHEVARRRPGQAWGSLIVREIEPDPQSKPANAEALARASDRARDIGA